jgi:hypothetical protein
MLRLLKKKRSEATRLRAAKWMATQTYSPPLTLPIATDGDSSKRMLLEFASKQQCQGWRIARCVAERYYGYPNNILADWLCMQKWHMYTSLCSELSLIIRGNESALHSEIHYNTPTGSRINKRLVLSRQPTEQGAFSPTSNSLAHLCLPFPTELNHLHTICI